MKRKRTIAVISAVLMLLSVLSLPTLAGAAEQLEVDGCIYTIGDDGTAILTNGRNAKGTLVIPDTVGAGIPVREIGENAFVGNIFLQGVTIPGSVMRIGPSAFGSAINLTSVEFNGGYEPEDGDIGGRAFLGTGLKELVIPNKFVHVGDSAFFGCEDLQSVKLQNGVRSIGSQVFAGCQKLANLTLPMTLSSAGWESFGGCLALESVVLPDALTDIPFRMFDGCSLSDVRFGSDLRTIDEEAFWGNQLSELVIPDGVVSIDDAAFGANPFTEATLPKSLTHLSGSALGEANRSGNLERIIFQGTMAEWESLIESSPDEAVGAYSAYTVECEDGTFSPAWTPDIDDQWYNVYPDVGPQDGWYVGVMIVSRQGELTLRACTDNTENATVRVTKWLGGTFEPVDRIEVSAGDEPCGVFCFVDGNPGDLVPIYLEGTLLRDGQIYPVKRLVYQFQVPYQDAPGTIDVMYSASSDASDPYDISVSISEGWIEGVFYISSAPNAAGMQQTAADGTTRTVVQSRSLVSSQLDFPTLWKGTLSVWGEPGDEIEIGFAGYSGVSDEWSEQHPIQIPDLFTLIVPGTAQPPDVPLSLIWDPPVRTVVGEPCAVSVGLDAGIVPDSIDWYWEPDVSILQRYREEDDPNRERVIFIPLETGPLNITATITVNGQEVGDTLGLYIEEQAKPVDPTPSYDPMPTGNPYPSFSPMPTGNPYPSVSPAPDQSELALQIVGPQAAIVGQSVTLTLQPNMQIDDSQIVWKLSPPFPFTYGETPRTITFNAEHRTTLMIRATAPSPYDGRIAEATYQVHIDKTGGQATVTAAAMPIFPTVTQPPVPEATAQPTGGTASASPSASESATATESADPSPSPSSAVKPQPTRAPELVPATGSITVTGSGDNRVINCPPASLTGDTQSVESFLSDIRPLEGTTVRVKDHQGEEVSLDRPVGTGLVVEMVNENGEVVDRAAVVVPGDVLGTGQMSLTQLVRMVDSYTGEDPLEGPFLKAADFSKTGSVGLTDLVREAKILRDAGLNRKHHT